MNETAVAIRGPEPVTALTPSQMFTVEQIETLKRTIARDATDTELDLFLNTCARLDLDPFRPGEIYFLKRRVKKTDRDGKETWEDIASIQPGIEYYRKQAEANPAYDSHTPTYWCGPDGVWKDVWLSDEPPAACKVGIWRKGAREPIWGVALWKSYVQTYYDKATRTYKLAGKWATMGEHMLSIAADKQAIRRALPRTASVIAEHDPTLYDEQESLPTMVDVSTGEITTPADGYTDYKDNERLMRRIHAIAKERELSHEDIRTLALSACNRNRKASGWDVVTSMSELTNEELEGTAAYLDRTSTESLRYRLEEINAPELPAPTASVVAVEEQPDESDPFEGPATGDLGNTPIMAAPEASGNEAEVQALMEALVSAPALTGADVQAEYLRRNPGNKLPGTWYELPVPVILELTEWVNSHRPATTATLPTAKKGGAK